MPRPRAVVTLKTIAKLAKVTPSVVSTVLTGHRGSIRFSEETAERVRAAAAQLHYRPDRMAQSLRAKEHQAIGLLASSLFILPHVFLHWLSLALGARDRLLIIQTLPGDDALGGCQMLQQRFVDAAICAEVPSAAVLQHTAEIGLPLLFINADPDVAAPRLLFDEAGGMRLAVAHLKQRGYRSIVLHDFDSDGYWVGERRKGCRAAAQALGLPPPRIISVQPDSRGSDGEEADRLAAACEPGTGIIAQSGSVAPFLLPRLAARGLRIPEDVGVVTLSHAPAMDMTWTMAEVNTKDLAATATEVLLTPGALGSTVCQRSPYVLNTARSTERLAS